MTREQAIKILKPIRDTYVDYANIAMTVEADNDADALEMALEALQQPEIIQCKDDCHWNDGTCYCEFHYRDVKPTDYCSWAERRTDETD